MSILIVFLILFGSVCNTLSSDKCRFDKIYDEVFRFCRKSDYTGCNSDLNNLTTFLKFFLNKTELFCNLPRIKDYCKPCSINESSWSDLVGGKGNATNTTGNGNTDTGNGTSTTGN